MTKATAETSTEEAITPREIGRTRTSEDIQALLDVAQRDFQDKAAAFKKVDTSFWSSGSKKWRRARDARDAAEDAIPEIKKEFYEGACEAFQEGRLDNIQQILSNPEAFRFYETQVDSNFTSNTLLKLMIDSDKPEAVPDKALAEIPAKEREEILNLALLYMFTSRGSVNVLHFLSDKKHDNKDLVSILLDAGAKANFASSITLAAAIQKNAPMEVIELLLEKGATFEGAREMMPHRSDDPSHITLLDRTRELLETKAELTRVKASASPASPKTATAPSI